MCHYLADRFIVAEAEVALMTFLWALFVIPATVSMFLYAWDKLLILTARQDACPHRTQCALLHNAAPYKPILRRLPYWVCQKCKLNRRITVPRGRRGEFSNYFTPPYNSSYLICLVCFAFKLIFKIKIWIQWIHTKFLRWNPTAIPSDLSNHIILNLTTSDDRGPIINFV